MSDNSVGLNGPSGVGSATRPKIRIVVADDHPIFRDGLCRLLALEEDFEVVAQAQDGRQVLDVLQQHDPDILLLDLKMHGLDGLALRVAGGRSAVELGGGIEVVARDAVGPGYVAHGGE